MSVVPELELPLEAFKARGVADDANEKVGIDGKAKCIVDRGGLAAAGEVVDNSSEEKNSWGEVFKEGPSEKGCSADEDFEGEDDEGGRMMVLIKALIRDHCFAWSKTLSTRDRGTQVNCISWKC